MKNKTEQTKTGKVVSAKMDKTIVVKIKRLKMHPLYKKQIRLSKKYHVHCKNSSDFQIGDMVTIKQSRPRAKTISWEVVETRNNKEKK